MQDEKTFVELQRERDDRLLEVSNERFDRIAFAKRALDLVCPSRTRIAIGEGRARVHVETGRNWRSRSQDARWAMLLVPRHASRRAIALGVLELTGHPTAYSLELLLALASDAA